MRAIDAVSGTNEATECEVRLRSGFSEPGPDGKLVPSFQSIGDLETDHHADCYRLYNLWREAREHNYQVGAAQPALSPEWEMLRNQAEDLSR
jgi:hypothetical protein